MERSRIRKKTTPAQIAARRVPGMPPLSALTRILLLILGWLLILISPLGLLIPGPQGVFTLILGAAALSLVSPTMLYLLRLLLGRWPRVWRVMLRLRRRVYRWIVPP